MLLERRDLKRQVARVRSALKGALGSLAPDERYLLQRRFDRGESIVDIARTLGIDPKALYRQFEAILGRIRRTLEAKAFTGSEVRSLVGHAEIQVGSVLAQSD